MSELVIETSGLRKVFRDGGRRTVAVDGLDLAVPAGGVHGFLGPNGSGKTTTLRMLLGLARPSAGEARLFGTPVPKRFAEVSGRVGAVVEEPAFLPSYSGRRNLLLLARTIGAGRRRVDQVLAEVGLERRDRRSFAKYSLGMKQRLAIAAALLKSPDLMLLDEPTNGLDPAGIRDIRELIHALAESGVTVLLSSHILGEVQQACDSVSIIDRGRLLASGKVSELLGEHVSRTRVGVSDPGAAAQHLRKAGYDVARDGSYLVVAGHEHPEQITRVLAGSGLFVHELSAIRPNLESVFLQLTGSRPLPDARPAEDADAAAESGEA